MEHPIIELRQYTLHPGQREALIDLFDREFVETQEAVGMAVLGQFRDLDRPDRFTWLRGFSGMDERRQGLQAFYGGPVWAQHRNAANATMIDSDNVLLLQPAWPGAGIHANTSRAALAQPQAAPGFVDITAFPLREPATAALLDVVRHTAAGVLKEGGALAQGWYVTHPGPNNFPRLPVREGEQVLVGIALFADQASFETFAAEGRWSREVAPALAPHLAGPPDALRLAPTSRSALHA